MAGSSFYYYQKQSKSPDKYKEIKELITAIYQRHKGRYGYRRITDELQYRAIIINHKTVLRPMKILGLKSVIRVKKYKYDTRNRLVEKKLPGKQWEFIVYDKLDRVVATGPALAPFKNMQNTHGWLITKYDIFNRAVVTGWTPFTSRIALQTIYSGATTFNEVKTTAPNSISGVNFNYTNNFYPTVGYHVLTINYYDDYNFNGAPASYSVMIDGQEQAYYNNTTFKPKGLPTGSWVRVLQASTDTNAEISYSIYDNKSRVVSQRSTNYLNGATRMDSKLDFSGKTLYTLTNHQRDATSTPLQIREDFTYTAQDRLLTHTHEVVGHTATELLAKNDYDELGQLIKKSVGGSDPSGETSLQKVDYSYNIRGWLKSINQINELTPSSDPTDLFAFSISYNEVTNNLGGTIKPLYNGNIAETFWKTDSDNVIRNYGYQYDNLNRLTYAIYQKANVPTNAYNENLSYDKNGNIIKLNRNGYFDTVATGTHYPIDELYYDYASNSNKLLSVYDQTNSTEGFKDCNTFGNDYEYDANGNMIQDKNKNISTIYYNHLNLPVKIEFGQPGQNEINYLYNALGVKVEKRVITINPSHSSTLNSTDYLGGFQYLNNQLQFFPTAEGYVSVTGGNKFNYVYNYTDHLGNIRLSYSRENGQQELKILEENHYYPFGLKHTYNVDTRGYRKTDNGAGTVLRAVPRNNYQYKYNGKELQDELGLNVYDYGARTYMPDLGRWMQSDPLINDLDFTFNPNDVDEDDENELAFSIETTLGNGGGIYNLNNLNPYAYGYNDPIRFDDPDGRCPNCFTAIAGALIGGGIELGGQLLSGKSLSEVDWADVGVETLKGGLIGSGVGAGAAAAIEGGSVVAKASFDYSSKDGNQNVFNGKKSVSKAVVDGATDVVAGKIGGAIGKKAGNLTEKGVKTATKAETKAVKEVSKATNKFNKVTDGGKNMAGSKSMVAKNTLEKAKGGAQVARGNTVRSQMVKSATKGVPGTVVNKAAQNATSDKAKQQIGY